jgi:hypothetical protein
MNINEVESGTEQPLMMEKMQKLGVREQGYSP